MQDAGLELPVTLEAVDFTDEEGTLIGTFGSLALAGGLTRDGLAAPRGGRELLVAELARMELSEEGILAARRDPASLAGYLELHIEQGPVLEQAGIDIGIVTGIVGTASFTVVFEGEARHAGTTPMGARRDAAVGAAAFVLGVRELVVGDFPGAVATVGDVRIEPGSFNVVPGRATLRLECRSLDAPEVESLAGALDGAGARNGEGPRARGDDRARRARRARAHRRERPRGPRGRGRRSRPDDDGARVGRRPRRPVARRDHPERDGVRPVDRRHQPRPGRGDGVGRLCQRRQRPAQRGRPARRGRAPAS